MKLVEITGSNTPKICLVVTSAELGRLQRIDYIALSHCWGNASIKTLLKENLATLKESIENYF
jgi:hypothetical protein